MTIKNETPQSYDCGESLMRKTPMPEFAAG